jgi:flagellum-specific ATP synthase
MTSLDILDASFAKAFKPYPIGRLGAVQGGLLRIDGVHTVARIGDAVEFPNYGSNAPRAEILKLDPQAVWALPDRPVDGLALGGEAILRSQPSLCPSDSWIGRVVDPFGAPLDGRPLMAGKCAVDLIAQPLPAARRSPLGDRLETGLAVMNTLLPIVDGQRIGLFSGSGVGKSSLLAHLTQKMQADVVVLALVGERGREVGEFVNKTLGREGMARAVVVAATSDQSPLMRRRCAWSAMAIAEHFRDQGKSVLFLMDSVTRFADAHREVAFASGEGSGLRGYPPSTMPLIAGMCERAGPGLSGSGSITAVFSVLVAGSDMDEPVADMLRGVLDGHVILSREIAERGRYPAIDVSRSVSRCLPDAASPEENRILSETRKLLGAYERSETMVRAGLYVAGSDPILDRAVKIWPDLDDFFTRQAEVGMKDSFDRLSLILRRG